MTRARGGLSLSRGWIVGLAVGGLTGLVFLRSVGYGFVSWDDEVLLTTNPAFRGFDWGALSWIVRSTLLGHYVPITWLSFALDYAVWGLRPAGYHLTNVLLHAVNAGLVSVLAADLLRRATAWPDPICRLGAAVAALFWGLHPLRVEAVSWVTGRRDVLSGLFFLLALIAYLKAAGRAGLSRRRWLIAAVAAYGLALGSKEIVMTAPLVLVALDVYPLARLPVDVRGWSARTLRGVWLEKIPFVVIAGLAAVGSTIAVRGGYVMLGAEAWLGVVIASLAAPLWRTIWPFSLSPLYGLPPRVDFRAVDFWAAVLLVAGVSVAVLALRRRWPAGVVTWIWYVAFLAPVMAIAHTGPQLTADRYSYLPALGLSVLGGALVAAAVHADRVRASPGGRAVLVVTIAVLAGLAGLSLRQQGVWQDTGTLWARAVQLAPSCARCQHNLGGWLAGQGRQAEAIAHYERALELDPRLIEQHVNFSSWLAGQGRHAEATRYYERALELEPRRIELHADFGNWLASQGRLAEAIAHYEHALELDPRRVELHANIGLALVRLGRPGEAVPRYERVLAQHPERVPVRVSLATALVAAERLPEAVRRLDEAARFSTPAALVEYFQQLTAAEPAASVPRLGLFQAYARVGDHVRAREAWEALAGLQPALARASLGDGPGASFPLRP